MKWILTIVLIFLGVFSCTNAPAKFILYNKIQNPPVVVSSNNPTQKEQEAIEFFVAQFQKSTNVRLKVLKEKNAQGLNETLVHIGKTKLILESNILKNLEPEGFAIKNDKSIILIGGGNDNGLMHGVIYFVRHYLHSLYIDANEQITNKVSEINLPGDLDLVSNPAFEYRETYFPSSMDNEYCNWNLTHHLDNEWGLWGHNLHKFLDSRTLNNPNIYSLINGERNKEQYCFSSGELLQGLIASINMHLQDMPNARRFAIMPNDNGLVCQCPLCTQAGNTASNASPAVFILIKKLAERFPNLLIFGSSYQTTKSPPSTTAMPSNVGVFVSTIDYAKGIPIASSKQSNDFKASINAWKKACKRIYIWDYAVEYTNYFDFFPVMKSTQKDLQLYKQLGVSGVFLQGSDDQFSLFGDLKSYVSSALLWNPDADIDSIRYEFIENAFPQNYEFVNDFYAQLEDNVLKANKKLDMYGSIQQSLNSYLPLEQFELFYYDLIEKEKSTKGKEKLRIQKIILALTFDKLEILRSNGCNDSGYGSINQNMQMEVKPEVNMLLGLLERNSLSTGISTYNEVGNSVSDYISQWRTNILNYSYMNQAYNSPYKVLTNSDEDYAKLSKTALNDGALGFTDYGTNWVISSIDNLELKFDALKERPNLIVFSFLQDERHRIFLPEKIEIYDEGSKQKITEQMISFPSNSIPSKKEIRVSLPDLKTTSSLRIKIFKKQATTLIPKPSMACDEIMFQ